MPYINTIAFDPHTGSLYASIMCGFSTFCDVPSSPYPPCFPYTNLGWSYNSLPSWKPSHCGVPQQLSGLPMPHFPGGKTLVTGFARERFSTCGCI